MQQKCQKIWSKPLFFVEFFRRKISVKLKITFYDEKKRYFHMYVSEHYPTFGTKNLIEPVFVGGEGGGRGMQFAQEKPLCGNSNNSSLYPCDNMSFHSDFKDQREQVIFGSVFLLPKPNFSETYKRTSLCKSFPIRSARVIFLVFIKFI